MALMESLKNEQKRYTNEIDKIEAQNNTDTVTNANFKTNLISMTANNDVITQTLQRNPRLSKQSQSLSVSWTSSTFGPLVKMLNNDDDKNRKSSVSSIPNLKVFHEEKKPNTKLLPQEHHENCCIAIEKDADYVTSKGLSMLRHKVTATYTNLPSFTVTINPMEKDELTYIPASTFDTDRIDENVCLEDVAEKADYRKSSIGSASSISAAANEYNTNLKLKDDLSIRRVSDISHIKQLRSEISGLDHLASEFYEISRERDPDAISLDSIHQQILKRCQNKYIPPLKSSIANKCFVIITTGFTITGIFYGFWYKNFGPGSKNSY